MSLPIQTHHTNTWPQHYKTADTNHWTSVAHIFVTTVYFTLWRAKVGLTYGICSFIAHAFGSTGLCKLINCSVSGHVVYLVAYCVTSGTRHSWWANGVAIFPRFRACTFVTIQAEGWKVKQFGLEKFDNKNLGDENGVMHGFALILAHARRGMGWGKREDAHRLVLLCMQGKREEKQHGKGKR